MEFTPEKYHNFFEESWKKIEQEYSENQALNKKQRNKVYIFGLPFVIISIAVLITGFALMGEKDFYKFFGVIMAGSFATIVSVILFFYFYNRVTRDGDSTAVIKKFIDHFLRDFLSVSREGIILDSFETVPSSIKIIQSPGQCFQRTLLDETTVTNKNTLLSIQLLNHLYSTNDISRMFGAGGFVRMNFLSSSQARLRVNDKKLTIMDAVIERVEKRTTSNGKTTTTHYVTIPCFVGTIIISDYKIDYPYEIEIGSKGSALRNYKLSKLQYEIASEEFNKELHIHVEKEDGAALRKALQPRMVAKLCDLTTVNRFAMLRSSPGQLTSMYGSGSGFSINSYRRVGRKFFKSKADAEEIVSKNLLPFLSLINDFYSLVDCDLLI